MSEAKSIEKQTQLREKIIDSLLELAQKERLTDEPKSADRKD